MKIKHFFKFLWGCTTLFKMQLKIRKAVNQAEIVFFFPYYHTGGAERVHAEIVAAMAHKKMVVFFTKGSATKSMLNAFEEHAVCIELNRVFNKKSKFLNALLTSTIIKTINGGSSVKKIFASNSELFYDLLLLFSSKIEKIDLFHAFRENDEREAKIVQSAPMITNRIAINEKAKQDILHFYTNGKCLNFSNHLKVISNGVLVPKDKQHKEYQPFQVAFIGRWSSEKRPMIFLEVAKKILSIHSNVVFVMAGSGTLPNKTIIEASGVSCLGDIHDFEVLKKIYQKTNVVVLVSEYEGFPMVFMEGMSWGCIPVSTNVGGISEHITSEVNGILINNEKEEAIVTELETILIQLLLDNNRSKKLSENAYFYAKENFSKTKFKSEYQKILE